MSNNHITYFKVENFKKFDSLEVKDIGQFNLIVGDNNVGKTCLLEALLVDEDFKKSLCFLSTSLEKRNLFAETYLYNLDRFNSQRNFHGNEIALCQKNIESPIKIFRISNQGEVLIEIENKIINIYNSTDAIIRNFIKKVNLFGYKEINENSNNWFLFYRNNELIYLMDLTSDFYLSMQHYVAGTPLLTVKNDNIQDYIFSKSHTLFEDIDKIEKFKSIIDVIFPSLQIKEIRPYFRDYGNENKIDDVEIATETFRKFHSISYYGDGFIRTLHSIFLAFSNQGKFILIDEIDTGIHYSKQKDFWINILKVCKELDVQLFATTHSKECTEAYKDALSELVLEEKGRLISLQEEKTGIKAYVYSMKNLDLDYEYRG